MRNYQLKLTKKDRKQVESMLKRGESKARVQTRCRILLLSEQGYTVRGIVQILGVGNPTVQRVRTCYQQEGLARALFDKPRPGSPRRITDKQRQRIVSLACSDPPLGYVRWTLRLLAEEAVRRKIVSAIGKDRVRNILQAHRLKPWRKKNVVCSQAKQGIS